MVDLIEESVDAEDMGKTFGIPGGVTLSISYL